MKFSSKITMSMICLLCILFGIGGSLMITLSFNDSIEREKQSAYHSYQTVLGTLQVVNSVGKQADYDDISNTLRELTKQNYKSWTAIRLYTKEKSIYQDGEFDFEKIQTSNSTDKCTIQYLPMDESHHYLAVSGSFKADKDIIYLDMVCDVSSIFASRQTQQNVYQIVFAVLIVLCMLLSYSISKILTHRLSELSKVSKAISDGELSRRARIKGKDEIAALANDFNTMVENLESNIKKQERFIASFAHESKTPMTSIIGYADLIRSGRLNKEEEAEAANYIVSEGKRLENLSQKLLELLVVREGDVEFSKVDIGLLIQSVVDKIAPVYKRLNITLRCECEQGVCSVESDLVKTMLINIIDNARKALDKRQGNIFVQSVMLNDGCRISVSDDGRGIPKESLEHLTEAFYRVDKSRSRVQGGAGIGLSLCREIIALHNGTIKFESEPGKGTTVIVELKGGTV